MIITIDGPAGTGKTTLAARVAALLSLPYFDTGAMYRAVTFLLLERHIPLGDEKLIYAFLETFTFEIKGEGEHKKYIACEKDVTEHIRSPAVNAVVSVVSALPVVRNALWKIQKNFAKKKGGVFEGRDMGTAVFPEAKIKIFLTARPEVRAQRRLEEIIRKRPDDAGHLTLEKVKEDLHKRDTFDAARQIAPLKKAVDAYEIDTSDLTLDQVVERILEYKQKKRRLPAWTKWSGVKFIYRIVLFLAWGLFKLFCRHRVYGLEHFYPRGALIASNHTSFLDPPILAISWPEEVHFLARETLFSQKAFGAFITALNAHPVSGRPHDIKVFKTVCSLLKEGKKVILFPEGTRSLDGQLGEIKPGITLFLERTGAALIPAYIHGSYEAWGRHRKWPKLFTKTVCVFGTPLLWQEGENPEAFLKKVEHAILALKEWLEKGAKGIPP